MQLHSSNTNKMDMEEPLPDEQKNLLLPMKSSRDLELGEISKIKDECRENEYTLEEEKMGICFIINNCDREQTATRRDVRRCEDLRNLGFDVKVYLNQTAEEMIHLREKEILCEKYNHYNCLVMIIIAHGAKKRKIFSVKQPGFKKLVWNLDELEDEISGVQSLVGKPKLLFVEACRGSVKNIVKKSGPILQDRQDVSAEDGGSVIDVIDINEKNELGGVQSSTLQDGKVSQDPRKLPKKMDWFIGSSTTESYVALTLNRLGSPYLQILMKEWIEGGFLTPFHEIHQTTRQKVENDPIINNRYMVPDETNRLHYLNLHFRNYLFRKKRGRQPLLKGCISYESKISFLAVSYNLRELCPDAHQVFASGYKISDTEVITATNEELPKTYYDLPKGSVVKYVNCPPKVFMEVFESDPECFKEASNLLLNKEKWSSVDSIKIGDTLIPTKAYPGFSVTDRRIKRQTVTFHKEFPVVQVTLSQKNQDKLQSRNTNSSDTFEYSEVFNEKWVEILKNPSEDEGKEKEMCESFLDYWDHHFVTECYQGGSITLTLFLTNDNLKVIKDIKEYLSKICSDDTVEAIKPVINSSTIIDIQFKGGNIEYHSSQFKDINTDQMQKWKESLGSRPAPLMSNLSIQPTHLAVACLNPRKGEAVRQVSEKLLKEGENWTTSETQWDGETATYTGETKDGKAHGQGMMKSAIGEYTGGFKDGVKSGHGRGHFCRNVSYYAKNLFHYKGEWLDDKPQGHGEGHFKHFNKGNIYIGQWKNGKPEGLGTVYYEDGKEVMVLCRKGHIEKVIIGDAQDYQIGTQKAVDIVVNKFRDLNKWAKALLILTMLSLLVLTGFGLYMALRDPTCAEALMTEWDTVTEYDYKQEGFLDVSIARLSKSRTQQKCQKSSIFMDIFPATTKSDQENIKGQCTSLKVPGNSTYEFKNMYNEYLQIAQRVYNQTILRFRTCDFQTNECSDMSKYSHRDVFCTPMKTYKPLSCLQAISSQWDTITRYNRNNKTLTVDMALLPGTTKDKCRLDRHPVTLEIFAISPEAPEDKTAYYSCSSYTGGDGTLVFPFGQKMALNNTGLNTFHYVSGTFVFRLSRGKSQACTYPKKVYQSERGSDIAAIWQSKKCTTDPKVTVKISTKWENDSCSLIIPGFPLHDCFLFDEKLPMTATMVLRMVNETHKKCKHKQTSNLKIWDKKTVNVTERTSHDKTPTLADVTLNLPLNATFCLEVFTDYPLCPSNLSLWRNKDDVPKCNSLVPVPLRVINCKKQWGI